MYLRDFDLVVLLEVVSISLDEGRRGDVLHGVCVLTVFSKHFWGCALNYI